MPATKHRGKLHHVPVCVCVLRFSHPSHDAVRPCCDSCSHRLAASPAAACVQQCAASRALALPDKGSSWGGPDSTDHSCMRYTHNSLWLGALGGKVCLVFAAGCVCAPAHATRPLGSVVCLCAERHIRLVSGHVRVRCLPCCNLLQQNARGCWTAGC